MSSRGVNKMICLGHCGNDPEVKMFDNGGCVANITIATSESWRDKQTGEQKEVTEWHRVAIHGKLGEIAGQYLKKGSQVYIEGALKTRKWQDQSGADRYTTEIVVQGFGGVMQMIGSKSDGGGNAQPAAPAQQNAGWGQPNNGNQPARQSYAPQQQAAPQNNQQSFNEPSADFDDDIPFAPIGLQHPQLLTCI